MDLVPMVNGAASQWDNLTTWLSIGALAMVAVWLLRQVGNRLTQSFTDAFINNWRLGLLGLTGVVLSVASGWTTWDGMRNFTKEPVLSFLITFGIQGVMLIVAWLIGESFATGMNHRPRRGFSENLHPGLRALQPLASSLAGILLFSALGILIYGAFVPETTTLTADTSGQWWAGWWDNLLIAVPVVLIVALLIVNAGSDVLEDYTQSLRIMVRSAVLWVMFLACMATSVFFSFNSLFSTIFPANERQRAAELRAQNQVAGVVNDVSRLAASRRLSEQERLFTADEWQRYEDNLNRLQRLAGGADEKLQAFFEERMRERQAELNRFQEDKSSAAAQQVSLVQRKDQLNSTISRLKEQVTNLQPEVERLKTQVFAKDRELIAKTAEAEAEAGGIGVTSKVGRGPKYREIMSELRRLREEKENLELQLRAYEKRLTGAREALTNSESELARTDGEIAKLKGRAETAERMISARAKSVREMPAFDATTGVQQLSEAREAFRREPTAERLTSLQTVCGALAGALRDQGDPTTRQSANQVDCDPGAASEAAARVFALNVGVQNLRQNCVGGDKLPVGGGADALFSFARRCVQDARLSSADTANLRQTINNIELNRDDKAHRFVVTTNAFQDGNKLAYLALAIAIAIDTLVFMSGLFGANAVRSPLSDVPSHKGRSARQLEDIVENALLPDKFENARLALSEIQPAAQGKLAPELGQGWTHVAVIDDAERARKTHLIEVLNAGASIGAVHRDKADPTQYYVRGELVEFLHQVSKKAFEKDGDRVKHAELRKVVTVSLQPYVSDHADIVLGHMNPISQREGFSSEIKMDAVPSYDVPIVRRALNAGTTMGVIERDGKESDRFFIRNEFYRILAQISADVPKSGMRHDFSRTQIAGPSEIDGGRIEMSPPEAVTGEPVPVMQQIADEHEAQRGGREPDAGRASNAAAIRRAFADRLIQAIDIEPQYWNQIDGEAFGGAVAASDVFSDLRSANIMLDRNIRQRDKHISDRLERAHAGLRERVSQSEDATWHLQLLDSAREDILQNWQVIMMLPKGPYDALLEQMIEAYERDDAEGKLDIEKQHLLRNVKSIRSALQANPRDSANAWVKLAQAFSHIAEEPDPRTSDTSPQVVRLRT